ncbi:MAG: hypothetical protein AABW59_04395 [archaeon]
MDKSVVFGKTQGTMGYLVAIAVFVVVGLVAAGIIIGAAILVVAIVILAVTGV